MTYHISAVIKTTAQSQHQMTSTRHQCTEHRILSVKAVSPKQATINHRLLQVADVQGPPLDFENKIPPLSLTMSENTQ